MSQTVDTISIDDIEFGDRFRKEYGDLKELAESIKSTGGLVSSFCVKKLENSNKPYLLLAGGRRLRATKLAGLALVPAIIYPADISNLKIREIELVENTHRKDLEWWEKVELTDEVHRLEQELHGVKTVGGPGTKGHSKRDTARLLGRSAGSVVQDLNLAKIMKAIPGLKKMGSQDKAEKFIKQMGRSMQADEVQKEIKKAEEKEGIESVHGRLIDYYHVEEWDDDPLECGFFKVSKDIASSIVDMVILDMPYSIDEDSQKEIQKRSSVIDAAGTWLNEDDYIPVLQKFLKESYRILKPQGWLICWFGPEPWFEPTFQEIIRAGFSCRRNPGCWDKNKGFPHRPDRYLGNAYELFYYARKGQAGINRKGRHNTFNFSSPHHTKRIHQTEKPVELEQEIMDTFLHSGARVLIPCLGSGNGILAAANLGMVAWGYDISKTMKDAFIINVTKSNPPNYKTLGE